MKITCDIICDLLPLYAEDMVSEDSKALVDEHLCTCEPCFKQLEILKKNTSIPVEIDTRALERVENTIRKRRILTVLTVLMFCISLIMGGSLLLDAKIYLTAEQAVKSVEELEDGSIRVRWTDDFLIAGTCSLGYSDDSAENYGILVWTPLRNLLFPRKRMSYEEHLAQLPDDIRESYPVSREEYNSKTYKLEDGASSSSLWYCNAKDGTGESLLWDAGNPVPEGTFVDVNYHLAYYCVILVILAVLLAMIGRNLSGKWYGELCVCFSVLLGCFCLSTILVTAGQFMEIYGEFTEAVIDSTAVGIPMTLTALCWRQLHLLNKQDKGV